MNVETMKIMLVFLVCVGVLKASTSSSLMTILISLEMVALGIFMKMVYSWVGMVVQGPAIFLCICVIESVIGLVIYVNLIRKGGVTTLVCLGM